MVLHTNNCFCNTVALNVSQKLMKMSVLVAQQLALCIGTWAVTSRNYWTQGHTQNF